MMRLDYMGFALSFVLLVTGYFWIGLAVLLPCFFWKFEPHFRDER